LGGERRGALQSRELRRRDLWLQKSRNYGMIPSCEPKTKRKRIDAVLKRDAAVYPGTGRTTKEIRAKILARTRV